MARLAGLQEDNVQKGKQEEVLAEGKELARKRGHREGAVIRWLAAELPLLRKEVNGLLAEREEVPLAAEDPAPSTPPRKQRSSPPPASSGKHRRVLSKERVEKGDEEIAPEKALDESTSDQFKHHEFREEFKAAHPEEDFSKPKVESSVKFVEPAPASPDEVAVVHSVAALVPSAQQEPAPVRVELDLLRSQVGHLLALLETDLLAEADRIVPLKLARSVHSWLLSLGPEAPPAAVVSKRIDIVGGIMNRLMASKKMEEKAEVVPGLPATVSADGAVGEEELEEKQTKTTEGKRSKKGVPSYEPSARDINRTQVLLAPRRSRTSSCRKPKKGHQQVHGLAKRSDGRYVTTD